MASKGVGYFLLVLILVLYCEKIFCFQQNQCPNEEQIVFVNSVCGKDNGSNCSEKLSPCKTLEYALTKRNLNCRAFTIFLSSNVLLTSVLSIDSPPNMASQFSILGNSNDTEMTFLQCSKSDNGNGSGIYIRDQSEVNIKNIIFDSCGWINFNISKECNTYYSANESKYQRIAVGIFQSANITIANITIQNSNGTGLALLNTAGSILVYNSTFANNTSPSTGGGLLILADFNSCDSNSSQNTFNVSNCTFFKNVAFPYCEEGSMGGGLCINIENSSCSNHVTIESSLLSSNKATWGGGLYSHFKDNVSNNSVKVTECIFDSNLAIKSGGGSNSGYFSSTLSSPPVNTNNKIHFKNVKFTNNFANYGGGSGVFSSHGNTLPSNRNESIVFHSCHWINNTAYFSSAIDISPYVWDTLKGGYLPSPLFVNCTFIANINVQRIAGITGYENVGVFMATSFTVYFSGHVTFISNFRTALYLMNSVAIFSATMNATFRNNIGNYGGAICLYGASMMLVNNDSRFDFINNTANYGGAIAYYSTDQHDYVSSKSCFIQLENSASTIAPLVFQNSSNVNFIFRKNGANIYGDAIYATSLWPCYFACKFFLGIESINDSFRCVGNFSFSDTGTCTTCIRTKPEQFQNFTDSQPVFVIPGMPRTLDVELQDETNATVTTIFFANLHNYPGLNVCNASKYTGVPTVCIEGYLNSDVSISIDTIGDRVLEFNLTIATSNCPPGYIFNNNSDCGTAHICVCSAFCKGNTYVGIESCSTSSFQAIISLSTWAGYYPSNATNGSEPLDNYLYTAPCISNFCIHNSSAIQNQMSVALPSNANTTLIEAVICAENRTGFLCAECTQNHSVYYHSFEFSCDQNTEYCHIGGLFYIISEIAPLTALFIVAIAFDVRFTSGNINGFILFCQVFNSFDLTAGGRVIIPDGAKQIYDFVRVAYGFFNLDFFSHPLFQFCIWEGAKVLDVLSFKYVTTLYGFGLIVSLILAANHCSCLTRITKKFCTNRLSFIHGLSAFVIVCYGQCAQVTCAILLPVVLFGKNGSYGACMSKYGGMEYFNEEHLRYAIPASAAAIVLVLLPIALIVNPCYNRVLQCCPCSESRCIKAVTLLCSKPKPLLDSFQGCFKDSLRFFSGLYFVYRLLPASVYMFVTTTLQGHILMESFLVSFLLVHAIFQPYSRTAHNVLDSLLFAILVAINSFTLFNYSNFSDPTEVTSVKVLCWSQVLLSCIPLCYIIWYIINSIWSKCQSKKTLLEVDDDMGIITSDRLEEISLPRNANYQTI